MFVFTQGSNVSFRRNFKDKYKVLYPQIDYGSVFDPLAGVKSRKYHKSKDYKLPKEGK